MNGSFKIKVKVKTQHNQPIEKSKGKDHKPWKSQQRQQQKRNWITFE